MATKELADASDPVQCIADHLRAVLRVGVRPAKLIEFLALLDLVAPIGDPKGREDPYRRAHDLSMILTAAVSSLGPGPVGLAAQALFGLSADTRGRLLKDRRRIAADHLDLLPSTFRKYHEQDIIEDVALVMHLRLYDTNQ